MSQEQGQQQAVQSPVNAPTPETPAPAPTPESNPELTARFTQLSKKEQALFRDREAFKKERADLQEKMKGIEGVNTKIQEFEKLKSQNAIEAIKYLGFSETDIFNALAGAPDPTPEQKTQALVQAELKKYQDQQAETQQKIQAEADTKTITKFKEKILSTIETAGEQYQFLNFYGPSAREQVFELIEADFKETGKVMPLQEALDTVEEYYENTARDMMTKVKKLTPGQAAVAEAEAKKPDAPLKPEVSPRPFKPKDQGAFRENHEAKKARLVALLRQTGLKKG